MKKRFIVLIEDTSTKEQNDAFIEWIRTSGLGWWHWFQNCWLLVDSNGIQSAADMRSSLKAIYGSANTFVIELSDGQDTWAGFGPTSDQKNMFTWIHKNWTKQ
jgi:hypothetical protein